MEKDKKNLLDALIARAEQSAEDKAKYISLTSAVLGDITVKVPPLKKVLEFMDESQETNTTYDEMVVEAGLTYESLQFLKDNYKELAEAYDEKDPAMLTLNIFEAAGAAGEVRDIASKVIDAAGLTVRTIKNS
jgi:hypothetical protein